MFKKRREAAFHRLNRLLKCLINPIVKADEFENKSLRMQRKDWLSHPVMVNARIEWQSYSKKNNSLLKCINPYSAIIQKLKTDYSKLNSSHFDPHILLSPSSFNSKGFQIAMEAVLNKSQDSNGNVRNTSLEITVRCLLFQLLLMRLLKLHFAKLVISSYAKTDKSTTNCKFNII